jgi:DNA primase large subunit
MKPLQDLARYPYLQDAKIYVKKQGMAITELIKDPLYERARTIAIERLDHAFDDKDIGTRRLSTESDCIMELFSYPLARMITCCVNDSYFTRRYALGEAVRFYKNLTKENTTSIVDIVKEFNFNIAYDQETNHLSIYFTDYLNFAPTRYKTWKLVNKELDNGYVTITAKELSRLTQEALRQRINQELADKPCHELIKKTFSEDIRRIQNKVATQRKNNETIPVGKLDIEKLPPCIKRILSDVQAGENVPHMGRFALVSFLSALKLTTQDIIDLFNTAPDFDEEKSRYQIDHITGEGSSTSYKPPGCDKLKTYGLCPSEEIDEICKKTNHPFSYYSYRWKLSKKKREKSKKKTEA